MQKFRTTNNGILTFLKWGLIKDGFFKHMFYVFFYKTFFIKFKFFKKFRRTFRKWLKKRRLFFYFFCKPNFLIHQKFKNARMGKGKGTPQFWVYKPILNRPLAILGLFSEYRVNSIVLFLKKYLNKYMVVKKKM